MDALFSGRKRRGTLSTKFKTDLIVREGGISAHGRGNWDTCEGPLNHICRFKSKSQADDE